MYGTGYAWRLNVAFEWGADIESAYGNAKDVAVHVRVVGGIRSTCAGEEVVGVRSHLVGSRGCRKGGRAGRPLVTNSGNRIGGCFRGACEVFQRANRRLCQQEHDAIAATGFMVDWRQS